MNQIQVTTDALFQTIGEQQVELNALRTLLQQSQAELNLEKHKTEVLEAEVAKLQEDLEVAGEIGDSKKDA